MRWAWGNHIGQKHLSLIILSNRIYSKFGDKMPWFRVSTIWSKKSFGCFIVTRELRLIPQKCRGVRKGLFVVFVESRRKVLPLRHDSSHFHREIKTDCKTRRKNNAHRRQATCRETQLWQIWSNMQLGLYAWEKTGKMPRNLKGGGGSSSSLIMRSRSSDKLSLKRKSATD